MFRAVVLAVLVGTGMASAQTGFVAIRFDVLPNPEIYRQLTPKQTIESVFASVERNRIDYLVAHLMDPVFVDGRLQQMAPYYENIVGKQLAAAGSPLSGRDLTLRIQERSTKLNFDRLVADVRQKITDDPESLKELKRFLKEGTVQETGETAVVTLADVKSRAVYLKKIDLRWFIENRREEAPAPAPPAPPMKKGE